MFFTNKVGFSGLEAQGLSAPPYFLSFIITIATTFLADRIRQRALVIIIMAIIGGAGYLMLAVGTSTAVQYAGAYLAAGGIFPTIANILPWVVNNQGNDERRGAGVVLLNLVGQCGPVLGTRIYPLSERPQYTKGHSICAAFMFFTAILALGLRTLLVWENKQLDKKYGKREDAPQTDSAVQAAENYGPNFRYVL